MHVRPKKFLGQHFLKNDAICARIAAAISSDPIVPVLEIGPGTGALTRHLIARGGSLTVVEVDRESIVYLKDHWPEGTFRILDADFLKLPLEAHFDGPVVVAGNFPYNISSQILFRVLEYKDRVPEVVGMFQKEVAQRIASPPGSRDYGILSVFIQAWYDTTYLFTVGPEEFIPPPKVDSGVLHLRRNARTSLGVDEALFTKVVKTAFNQRRKTLRNSLRSLLPPGTDTTDPIFNLRPERLGGEEWVGVVKLLS
ncbi:MAG: 16S rRNA (adenine(1518)-N(6)/adenine(1519)-N(6))-dimethyltransferase RsmA [Flavobacteriales bacterium]|nr:16S rRNA (adenine(1518)-N(6)/adenine(1519)-N(6))-dimethyltransferase RsmA [Flavobacteriales bacterium]